MAKCAISADLRLNTVNDVTKFITHNFSQPTLYNLLNGITHVTLVNKQLNDKLYTIRNTTTSITHPIDTLLLNICRSVADCIIITSQTILCDNNVTMNIFGQHKDILYKWRNEYCNKYNKPDIFILTRNKDMLINNYKTHPMFHTGHNIAYYASSNNNNTDNNNTDNNTLYNLLCRLKQENKYKSISIEAGPHTTLPCYQHLLQQHNSNNKITKLSLIDNLLLTIYNKPLPHNDIVVTTTDNNNFALTQDSIDKLFSNKQCCNDIDNNDWLFCSYYNNKT